jgi:hypothetical protein
MVERHLQPAVSIIGCQDGIAVVGQRSLKHIEDLSAVFDDEHCRGRTLGSCHAGTMMVKRRSSKRLAL